MAELEAEDHRPAPPPRRVRSPRYGLCLDCRSVLDEGQPCGVSSTHEVVELDTFDGRADLEATVWPARLTFGTRVAQCLRKLVFRRLLLLTVVPWVASIGLLLAAAISGSHWPGALAFLTLLMGLGFSSLAGRMEDKRPPPVVSAKPRGVPEVEVVAAAAGRLEGTVRGDSRLRTPFGDERCLGYGLELRAGRAHHGPIVLRESRCQELLVELDDGRRVLLPAGRLWIEMIGRKPTPLPEEQLIAYLRRLGPDVDRILVPADRYVAAVLRSGDRVAVCGHLGEQVDRGERGGYRGGSRVLVPRGLWAIELLPPAPMQAGRATRTV